MDSKCSPNAGPYRWENVSFTHVRMLTPESRPVTGLADPLGDRNGP